MAKKTKIPKRIGGVKLPKEWRRAGDALIERAQGPEGREMLVGALAMAASVTTAAMARRAAPPATDPAPGTAPNDAGKPGTPDPMAFVTAIGGMAEAALGQFFGKRV